VIAAEVEVLDYTQPIFPMPHFKSRPSLPLKAFLTGYLEAGGRITWRSPRGTG